MHAAVFHKNGKGLEIFARCTDVTARNDSQYLLFALLAGDRARNVGTKVERVGWLIG